MSEDWFLALVENMPKQLLDQCLSSLGREYEFPSGGQLEILLPCEATLLAQLKATNLSEAGLIDAIADGLQRDAAYSVAIFSVRLATLAARENIQDVYRLAVVLLLASYRGLDWRDSLGVFSIFEFCALRIGCVFQAEVERIVALGKLEQLQFIAEAFFARSPQMRSLDTMGVKAVGSGKQLTFARVNY